MNATWYEQAEAKLKDAVKTVTDRVGKVVAQSTKDTLLIFAAQNEEFAQAVVEGGSFKDCVAAATKGASASNPGIPDIEVYRRAVNFYFEGATVHFTMHIQLEPEVGCEPVKEEYVEKSKGGGMTLSLDDFLL